MRQTLLKQARLIRVQWGIILALALAVILLAVLAIPPAAQAADTDNASPAVTKTVGLETEAETIIPVLSTEPPVEETAEPELIPLGEFKLTAYCPCEKCCGKSEDDPYHGITAYGYTATAGRTIAVDPKVIPIGSEVVINGHTYIAEDVGGAIKENRIDIFFDTHREALEFGVQNALVYLKNSI